MGRTEVAEEDMSFEDRRRRFVRLVFLLVVPLLFLQLPLRRITESYPAILFPAGASLVRDTDGTYTVLESEFLAADASGRSRAFRGSELLKDVPAGYRQYVVERGFGVTEGRDVRRIRLPFGGRRLELGHPLTAAQIAATREWLRARLRALLGMDAVRIEVRTWAAKGSTVGDATGGARQLREQRTIALADQP